MGCPVPKVVNNGDGSALMKNPKLAGEIIEKTARAIKKPVTVKIRKGFDEEHVNAVEMAHIAQESGACLLYTSCRDHVLPPQKSSVFWCLSFQR